MILPWQIETDDKITLVTHLYSSLSVRASLFTALLTAALTVDENPNENREEKKNYKPTTTNEKGKKTSMQMTLYYDKRSHIGDTTV